MREYRPEDLPDPRNARIRVHVGGALLPRARAKVSVFDSSVQGGDAVWEGLRLYEGGIFRLTEHLERLERSARALAFRGVPQREEIVKAIVETLEANDMWDEVHIRLTLTRGMKTTSGMSPELNRAGCCLIVLAEWKPPVYSSEGIRLVTSSVRRNPPQVLDSKIHHNNLLNNILAKIEANAAGADDAVMLDIEGFLAETNATNLFLVDRGVLKSPATGSCLPGITRAAVLDLARENDLPVVVERLSPSELYVADEVFTTGTMGEITPVLAVDGRIIGEGIAGATTRRIRKLFAAKVERERERLPWRQ